MTIFEQKYDKNYYETDKITEKRCDANKKTYDTQRNLSVSL